MAIRRLMMMGLSNWIRSLINTYKESAATNQLQFEAESCMYNQLDSLNKINLLGDAYTVLTPNTFFEGKVAGLYPAISNTPIVNELSYTNIFYALWTNSNTATTRVSVTNPFGGSSSNQIAETANTAAHTVSQPLSVMSGVTYTYSTYLKKGIGATSPDIMQLTFGTNGFNATLYANFNISLGTITSSSGVTPSISNAGGGWWRCSITTTASSTNTNAAVVTSFTNNNPSATRSVTYLGVTTSSTYTYGAQLEIGSSATLYQEIDILSPNVNNYASFIKGSSLYSFRTINNGLLETSPWNLSSYTEEIPYWTITGVTTTPYASNSPIGTLTATRVIETVANTNHIINTTTITLREIIPLTVSIYMKKGIGSSTPDWMQLTLANTAVAGTQRVNFNINTGSIGSTSAIFQSITDAGNGWWLCQATFVPQIITSATNIQVAFTNNSSTASRIPAYAGSVNSDAYLWGAQMVEGTAEYPYLPTTVRQNFPRINYYDSSPNTINSCPNFLLETNITNSFLNSEVFSSVWVTSNMTVTPDQEQSPHPAYNGDTLTATSNNAYITQSAASIASNVVKVFSVWLKRKTGNGNVSLRSGDASTNVTINNSTWTRCWICNNAMSATYSSVGTAYTVTVAAPHGLITGDAIRFTVTSGTAVTQNISTITVTSTTQFTFSGTSVTTSGNCNIVSNAGRIILSTNGDEVYAWGAQFELAISNFANIANVIPTTYVSTSPTTTVTRSSDTMIAENPGTAQATFYAKLKRLGGTNSNVSPFIAFSDGPTISTSQNSIHCVGVAAGAILWYYRAAGGAVTSLSTNSLYSPDEVDYFDILVTVDNSATYKFNIWMNGSLIVSSTASIDTQSLKYAVFGSTQPILNLKEYVSWDRVLTNDEITSLFAYPYYNTGYNTTNVELQQIINRAYAEGFTLPSNSILAYCDGLITSMKSDGAWNLSDTFFNFAYNDSALTNFARINWMNPYGALGLVTLYGSITYQTNGFKGDGSTAYIDTRFNASFSRSTANYLLNSAGRMVIVAEDATSSTMHYDGVASASRNNILRSNSQQHRINCGSSQLAVSFNMVGVGLKSIMRDSSTVVRLQNISTTTSTTQTSSAIEITNQFILRSGSTYADACISSYYTGGSLSNTQISNFRTYYNQYLVNIGLSAFA